MVRSCGTEGKEEDVFTDQEVYRLPKNRTKNSDDDHMCVCCWVQILSLKVSLFRLIELQYLDVTLVQETHSDGKNEEGKERPGEVILSPKLFYHVCVCGGGITRGHIQCEKMGFLNVYAPVLNVERMNFLNVL